MIKNNDNSTGVLRDKYDEQGNETTEFIELSIYNETETEYYIDTDTIRTGDILIKPDSNDRYTVSKTDTLIGVYNINKGYADFRQVKILYQNDEYAIVRSNTMYGLNVYDYIILDSSVIDAEASNKPVTNSDESSNESSIDSSGSESSEEEATTANSDASVEETSEDIPEEENGDELNEGSNEGSELSSS